MSGRHAGEYVYWAPKRVKDYARWARAAWLFALILSVTVVVYAVTVTGILVIQELNSR